jgi:hypothetical protein
MTPASLFNGIAQAFEIVDFAVETYDISAGRRDHGLCAGLGQIDHGEPSMPKRRAGLGIYPDAAAIRTTMSNRVAHGARCFSQAGHCLRPACEKACDPAHLKIVSLLAGQHHASL